MVAYRIIRTADDGFCLDCVTERDPARTTLPRGYDRCLAVAESNEGYRKEGDVFIIDVPAYR